MKNCAIYLIKSQIDHQSVMKLAREESTLDIPGWNS